MPTVHKENIRMYRKQYLKVITQGDILTLFQYSRRSKVSSDMWVGATDMAMETDWKWTDGEPVNWTTTLNITQPAANVSQNCLVTTSTDGWDHRPCSDEYWVLCEMDMG